jgi:hypothetical protein
MKAFLVTAVLVAGTTGAEASEAWTCSYSLSADSEPLIIRFEMSPPDLIDTSSQDHYRILQNNDYGLVATLAVSGFQEGQKDPAVGAVSIVINKSTGEFWWDNTFAGTARIPNGSSHGKCQKDYG